MRTSCEGVVEGVEEKGVVAVCAGYAAHTLRERCRGSVRRYALNRIHGDCIMRIQIKIIASSKLMISQLGLSLIFLHGTRLKIQKSSILFDLRRQKIYTYV